jgi:phenylacetate-CoA ligase
MIYNYFLEKIILPFGDMLTGSSFMKELKTLRKQDSMSEKELALLQKKKLKSILAYAVEHSPYYGKYKEKQDNDPVIFLKRFPVLDKTTLRKETDALLTTDKSTLIKQSSSGSSGVQTTVYFDKQEQSIQRAYQIRWWEWAGYRMGDPILQTGITPKRGRLKKIKDLLFRTYYLPAFSHTEENVIEALSWASRQKEPVLAGYASSLYVIAKIAKKHHIHIKFKTAISWGDKLFEHYRDTIEEVFGCNVHETYASSEGFMIAAQKDVPYMYLMTANVYVEIVDDEGNEVADGELGHVLVTKLDSFTMPMIRYKIGDLAIKLPRSEYPKNRNYAYPLLKKVIGRDTDLIKTYTGKYMVVHSFTGIIEHYPELKQYTVIQKDLEGITIQYIPDDNFKSSILDKIKSEILSYLEEDGFYIYFEKVDYIAPTPSGKPQIIQSFLNRA